MNDILKVFIDRKKATILFLVVAILLGYVSYLKMPRESNPDVKIPVIYIAMRHDGISPEDGQKLLLQPMENALRSVIGIEKMTSYAQEGSARIILEFNAGFDSEKALKNVRDKVSDTTYKLPEGAETPTVHEVNLSLEPVLNVILVGDKVSEFQLTQLARNLKNRIESVEGVLEVFIGGERQESVEIIIQPETLRRYAISVDLLRKLLAGNNELIAAGTLQSKGGSYAIKVPSIIKNVEELLSFPVKADKNGILKLGDIAEVKKVFKDAKTIARVNGKPALVLEISKKTGANIINTVQAVKKEVFSVFQESPADVDVLYSQDQSDQINEMVLELENSIILAGFLVLIVIVFAVGMKSALLIALSLPASFLIGILFMSYGGVTLNIVVLFSLILTIGMIVDDAIVVSEYADRKMIEGEVPQKSFLEAATRMFWPIVTSTLVKIVVFLPLLFWPGVMGQFMKYMPITVIVILTNSLLFALLFQPAIGSLMAPRTRAPQEVIDAIQASEDGDLKNLRGWTSVYVQFLSKLLLRPKFFVFGICAFLIIVYMFFFVAGTGVEFFPKIEPSSATISIGSPGNLSLHQRDEILREIESKILDMKDDVKVFYSKSYSSYDSDMLPKDTIATIQLELEDWRLRRKAALIFQDIKQRLSTISGINFQIIESRDGPPSQKPIEINFSAKDYTILPPFVAKLRAAMEEMGGFQDLEDSRSVPAIEWRLNFNRELAAKYRVSASMIGDYIKLITTGLKISSYTPSDADDEVGIVIRYPENRRLLSELDDIVIITHDNRKVPIGNFVKRVPAPQVQQIKRIDQDITISVKSNVQDGVLVDDKMKEIKKWLEANLERDITVKYAGDDKEQKETGQFLSSAFCLALIAMFMIMLIQFNNFYHTFVVMSAVFLSTVGVLLGLIISWQPFGIVMCGIGIIALAGVVLNNNILFVDTYQYLRKKGFSVEESALRSGAQRVRPIILTALTAVLGLLPMVFGVGINLLEGEITYNAPSSQWWRQLAASIAGGLSFATVLTLFFTPCLLILGKRFESKNQEI